MLAMCPKEAGLEGDGGWDEYSSSITAVIGGSTPTVVNARLGGENAEKYSPLTYVRKDLPPMLLIQGLADTTVRPETVDAFVEKLKATGFDDLTYVKIEGAPHSVAYEQFMDRSMRAINEFLQRTLKTN